MAISVGGGYGQTFVIGGGPTESVDQYLLHRHWERINTLAGLAAAINAAASSTAHLLRHGGQRARSLRAAPQLHRHRAAFRHHVD